MLRSSLHAKNFDSYCRTYVDWIWISGLVWGSVRLMVCFIGKVANSHASFCVAFMLPSLALAETGVEGAVVCLRGL